MRSVPSCRARSSAVLVVLGWLIGCASESELRKDESVRQGAGASSGAQRRFRPGSHPLPGTDQSDDGLIVENEQGVLDQRDVDQVLERHVRSLVGCYDRAGEAQKYVAGRVLLKFQIAKTGAVSDILVVENSLGNYAVERCLVVEGRRIPFPPPRGERGTEFEYSLEFRSTGERVVVDWDPDVVAADVNVLSPELAPCGRLGPASVRAIAYVEPGGTVGSVGLVSKASIDPIAAICAVEQMRKWKLPDDTDHVVRIAFPVMVSVAAPDPRGETPPVRRRAKRSTRQPR